ncbi:Glycine--tRNA ligase beta subunit [Nymphon striatum]|nr:Glycine--tRNA ligase beta subunit [Nymphon striatum]
MLYLQNYAGWAELDADQVGEVQLQTIATGELDAIVTENVKGLDTVEEGVRLSGDLSFRACFTTPQSLAMLSETYVIMDDAEPLTSPGWFDCYDARTVGGALETGEAIAFRGQENISYGVDRVVAVFPDGRGFVWHQLNDCGDALFAARMQAKAAADLKKLVTDGLVDAGLTYASAGAFSTPRRLALSVEGLLAESPDTREERKGPKVGAPDQAIEGFCRGAGVSRDSLEARETGKGEVYFAVIEKPGEKAADIIARVLDTTIRNFPWPKSMRWGNGSLKWVRPLHSILCILSAEDGADVVPMTVEGIASGNTTKGHRFMGPDEFSVTSFDDYEAKLKRSYVVLRADERADMIWSEASNQAFAAGLELVEDKGLLAEVAGLVEWPVVLMGTIADDFLSLPPEVLTASMKEHQKFFSVRDKTGQVVRFVTVANRETSDQGATILAGNQKVLFARLSDAKFFWENDLRIAKTGGQDWLDALSSVTFHNKLGTVAELVDRMATLSREIAPMVGADPKEAEDAARFAKADLSSEMIYEFPDLQGLMGRYYAKEAGLSDAIAAAAQDHYSPLGPSDDVPTAPVSVAVALAEKIDKLTGFWAIDEKPTGSKDPFALRRAALGVIRLVLENRLTLKLSDMIKDDDLIGFFHDRLKVFLKDEGVSHDTINASLAMPGNDDLLLLVNRAKALAAFLKTDDGVNLIQGFKRANNILSQAEDKDGVEYSYGADIKFAEDEAEKELFAALDAADAKIAPAMAAEDFATAMAAMAELRGPIDGFFETVQINAGQRSPARRDAAVQKVITLKDLCHVTKTAQMAANVHGGRAKCLQRLIRLDMPVPTTVALSFDAVRAIAAGQSADVPQILRHFEDQPLLSVRPSSMDPDWGGPGAMLNIGMNDTKHAQLCETLGEDPATKLYMRYIQSFAVEVARLDPEEFYLPDQPSRDALKEMLATYEAEMEAEFPQDAGEQLGEVLRSMARTWEGTTARLLRQAKGAPEDAGLGLVVQEMALAMGPGISGSGVIQFVNNTTGIAQINGRFAPQATHTEIIRESDDAIYLTRDPRGASLEDKSPEAFKKLTDFGALCRIRLREEMEIKFILRDGELTILDAIRVQRSNRAAVRIAVDLATSGVIPKEEAVMRVQPAALSELLHRQVDRRAKRDVLVHGIAASPGAAHGRLVFTANEAQASAARKEPCVLVRRETTPEDIRGMHAAAAVVTLRGGVTSHAAVIGRGMGLPCIVGAADLDIDEKKREITVPDGRTFGVGDVVTVDGTTGQMLAGQPAMLEAALDDAFQTLLSWADEARDIGIRANADTPADAQTAQNFAAQGIGLCRTEHMFFDGDRVDLMREMIFAETPEGLAGVLKRLLPLQRADFKELFRIMKGQPVCIRLFDAPLHEFLPAGKSGMRELAEVLDVPLAQITTRVDDLSEYNPMLGQRGVRLGITVPEIYDMQARAIFEATAAVSTADDAVIPEIMIPAGECDARGRTGAIADRCRRRRSAHRNGCGFRI